MAAYCRRNAEEARRVLNERVAALQSQVAAVRLATPDGVHDLRVASRRLVAAIAVAKRVAPNSPWALLRQQTRQITKDLGRARELDVMLLQIAAYSFPKDPGLAWARDRAQTLLVECRAEAAEGVQASADLVESDAFVAAVDAVLSALVPTRQCHLKLARKLPQRAYQRARAAYLQWRDTRRDADLHDVRIALKKFRYTCELYASAYDDAMLELLDALKALQDDLGHWNDCRMLRLELRALAAAGDADTRAAMRVLAREVRREGKASGKVFSKVAEKFFGRGQRRALRRLFRAPAVACCRETAS
jgi:CHAD domain-containing protein